ncbi:MAG TPA: zinc ABC transporter substrate-binding protein, partial [Candidatus Angelobacter sp.]|nr:zinc ABC transporter substrate-binding protein [Candidatus Angelobacter sp.]
MKLRSKVFSAITSAALVATLLLPSAAEAKKLKVITTLTDLASLTQEVGGDKVDVEALAKGYQ